MSKLVSWTGWTREDYSALRRKLSPVNLIAWTGWSAEDWGIFAKKTAEFCGFFTLFIVLLYMVFLVG